MKYSRTSPPTDSGASADDSSQKKQQTTLNKCALWWNRDGNRWILLPWFTFSPFISCWLELSDFSDFFSCSSRSFICEERNETFASDRVHQPLPKTINTAKVEREVYLIIQFCDLVNSVRFLAEKLLDLVSELLFCYCEIKHNAKYIKVVKKIF